MTAARSRTRRSPTVTAASKLGEVHLLVAGKACGGVAEAAAKIAGVGKVHVADDAAYRARAGRERRAAGRAADGRSRRVRRAGDHDRQEHRAARRRLLDVMQITDILSVESADTFTRPIYAGNAIATVQSKDAKKVITVRGTAFEKAATEGGSGGDREGRRPRRHRACRASSAPSSPRASGPS